MRFAIFSSLITRSSTARSSLQGLVALSALVVLTGAKGQGCGSPDEPTTPTEPDCGQGFHWETVCSPCEIGEMCEEQCVPDNVCPPGWGQQTFCSGSSTSSTTSVGQGGMAGGGAMPVDPGGCWTECVPPPPFCPPGTIEQTVCSGGVTSTTTTAGSGGWTGTSGGVGGSGGWAGTGGMMPMPPNECWTECVPVEPYCPPGTQAQTVCGGTTATASGSSSVGVGGSDGGANLVAPPYPGDCWTECVPVEPYCPPGTQAQTACDGGPDVDVSTSVGAGGFGGAGGSGTGSSTGAGWGGCWTECVPVEPYCPPDTIPQTVCGGSAVSVGSTGTGTGIGGNSGTGGGGIGGNSGTGGGGIGGNSGTGGGGIGGSTGTGGCWTECVPVEPYCPPGTQAQQVCYDGMPEPSESVGTGYGGSGSTSGGGWGGCFFECVPVEPYCPPGSIEQQVCSGAGSTGSGMDEAAYPNECWTECVEGSNCPPESIERTICEQPAGGSSPPVCRTECVLMLP
ncbi:hypothetical protein [Sorangium sp. So ce887]|uniref:hypothetical protein n=1 Tax=Sorangium sp. So ce887 TaxID=3133324 RepID=UPI003F6349D5